MVRAQIDRARRRLFSARHYAARHQSARALGISADDVVVDMGSGQDPHPRANILCDKFLLDNAERGCGGDVLVDRPLVVADATRTPFPDKSADFVVCSHLLEHMEDPQALLAELERVGKAGLIETPSKVYEKLWGWRFHRWYVSVEGDRLVLEAKDRAIFDGDLHQWFSKQMDHSGFWHALIPRLLERELLTIYVWRGRIAHSIVGRSSPDAGDFSAAGVDADGPDAAILATGAARPTAAQRIKRTVDRRIRRRSDARAAQLLEELRCPACRCRLLHQQGSLFCPECGVAYPVRNGVFFFLPPGASGESTS